MPKKKIIRPKKINVNDLLALIPNSVLDQFAEHYDADKWVRKLKAKSMFKLVFYSLLRSNRLSLRQLAENYSAPWFRILDQHAISETAHNSIRDRLLQINVCYIKAIYEHVYEQLEEQYAARQLNRYHIKRFDSTMVHTFAYLLEGMRVGNTAKDKHQVKLSTQLSDAFLIRMNFHKDQIYLSEEIALKELIESSAHHPDDILVFDRGLRKRATLTDLSKKQLRFVTRLGDNSRYRILDESKELPQNHPRLQFLKDCQVHLYATGNKPIEHPFRMIEVIRKEDKKPIRFLTNIQDIDAVEIAMIYAQRWDIEILFKFLKQEMNLTHFVCHNQNAIQVMIYMTLIAAMMILLFRKLNQIRSFRIAKIRFYNELQIATLLDFIESNENIEQLKRNANNYLQKL